MRISDWSSDVCSSDLATAATHDLDPTAHTITHMTGRKSTRSRRSEILAHHRSSQRAAISIPQQLPARRPSGHGYAYSSSAERLDRPAARSEEHTSELQ